MRLKWIDVSGAGVFLLLPLFEKGGILMKSELSKADICLLLVSVLFCVVSVGLSVVWYAKRNGVSYIDALLVLWQEGIVEGFRDIRWTVFPILKESMLVIRNRGKQLAYAMVEYVTPKPMKHIFEPDIYDGFYRVLEKYVFPPFQPQIDIFYCPLPSCIRVSFYTRSAISEATADEIVWLLQAKFREYLSTWGLGFEHIAVPYVQDNYIEVHLYYCEFLSEYPVYREFCRRIMLLRADPVFQPMQEKDAVKAAGIVLGYDFERWKAAGQAVLIVWDEKRSPHLLVSGPTGGGKTVFVKLVLEQLLAEGTKVTICDFKGFSDLKGIVSDYAAGEACNGMLTDFCRRFEEVRHCGVVNGQKNVLIFDEFGSFSASKTHKEFDELMRMLSPVIFMGRSYGYQIILVSQRFDADTIKTSLREQFGTKVYMGSSISAQSQMMLFPNSEINKSERLEPYCGYISTPKVDNAVLTLPQVDIVALDKRLKKLGKQCRK